MIAREAWRFVGPATLDVIQCGPMLPGASEWQRCDSYWYGDYLRSGVMADRAAAELRVLDRGNALTLDVTILLPEPSGMESWCVELRDRVQRLLAGWGAQELQWTKPHPTRVGWHAGVARGGFVSYGEVPDWPHAAPDPELVELPAASVRLGLDRHEAMELAERVAAEERARVEADPDPLHGFREAVELEARWGNAAWLCEQIAFSWPARTLEVGPFAIAKSPVTEAHWSAFVRETGARRPAFGVRDAAAAVEGVSWHEADRYARWRGLRLPTEDEWEHAARSGVFALSASRSDWCADAFAPYPGADLELCERIATSPSTPAGWAGTRPRRGDVVPGFPPLPFLRRGMDPASTFHIGFRLARSL